MRRSKRPSTAQHRSHSADERLPTAAYHRPRVVFSPMAALGWLLLTVILSTGPLELAVADQSSTAYFSAAGLGAFAVLGALLTADLRRAAAMTRAGLAVDRIELSWLRGRVIATGEVGSPAQLRRLSWVGPLALCTSAAALAATGALLSLGSSPSLSLLAAAALTSAAAVGAFALFDLLPVPGTPGSQLISARSWRRSGRRETGVLAAGRAGVLSGWFLVMAGVVLVTTAGLIGWWLIVMGALTIGGSRLMLAGARAHLELVGLTVSDVMSAAPPEVSSFATADFAFKAALTDRASILVVRESDGSFGGIVNVSALAMLPESGTPA